MAVRYSAVTLDDKTIYSDNKGYKVIRLGDTLIIKLLGHGNTDMKIIHVPWIRVYEAEFHSNVSDSESGVTLSRRS